MNKKEKILDALEELLIEGVAGIASVSDIAKKAGIAKGGLYYYFKNKEAVFDALVSRQYANIICNCERAIMQSNGNAIVKFVVLFQTYYSSYMNNSLDAQLHMPNNAAIHQKSLAEILLSLSPIITSIIIQGIEEGIFICEYPQEYSEILLSVFTFLMDPGIFKWTPEEKIKKLKATANMLEKGLNTAKGSFSFLYR